MANPEARLDELIVRLREQRHRLTPQRMAVLRILAVSEGHPSVEQIYQRVKADFPMTSLATVYKTVTLLKEMGGCWNSASVTAAIATTATSRTLTPI
jgi:Fur family peroxide stress response transcriptional regulator